MLKKIKIINFKTHRRTVLYLHPGINGIIGDPNAGKSNIRKAIEWVAKNNLRKFNFHSDFTFSPNTEVEITLDDNHKIKLKKNSKSTEYYINKEKPYRKFGTSVPDRIKQKLNFSDINFMDQHDPPFLVTSPPPEIARTINKITNIESIDKCVQFINKYIYGLKQKSNVLKADVAVSQTKLKRFTKLKYAKIHLDKAKKINDQIELNSNEITEVEMIADSIKHIEEVLKNKDKINKATAYIKQAEQIKKELEYNYVNLTLLESVNQLKETIRIAKREKRLRIREFIKELKDQKVCPVCLNKITVNCIHTIKEEMK